MIDCPVPLGAYDHVVLGHGAGGRLSAALVDQIFLPAFDNPTLRALEDAAILPVDGRIAVTTDAFVVSPRSFPGGDIGKLAACGTINDLAAAGAIPRYLTASFILEEGLPLAELRTYVESLAAVCRAAHVAVVAGDTKVVERGKGDGVFITTTGVGVIPAGAPALSWHAARPGDRIVVSGPIADHGIAILAQRTQLGLEPPIASDCAPVHTVAAAIAAAAGANLRGMRDPTRGGVASALNELAVASRCAVEIHERAIPVRPPVRAACEILGLDPLYVACEGRLVAVVAPASVEAVLAALPDGAAIGEVKPEPIGVVSSRSAIGTSRVVPLLSGEQLPRIC